jgi:hypothetical protein
LKRPREGVLREALLLVKIPKKLELLFEGGLSGRIVAAQALELRLEPREGFDDGPDTRLSPFLEGKVALEAIDEKELSLFFDDEERIIAVDLAGSAPPRVKKIEGDLPKREFPEGHR